MILNNISFINLLYKNGFQSFVSLFEVESRETRRSIRSELMQQAKVECCLNPSPPCTSQRYDGYEYCIKHIFNDPLKRFVNCQYDSGDERKCPNIVPTRTPQRPGMPYFCCDHKRHLRYEFNVDPSRIQKTLNLS